MKYIYRCRYRWWKFCFVSFVCLFPKQVYLWGSLLEKNRLDTLLGALGLVGRGFGPAGRAGLGWAWGLAVLGALAGLGVVLGVLWVGRGVWLCWARWLGWAPGLAVLGALAGLGVVLGVLGALAGLGVVLGVGFGRLGALAGLGVVLGVGFGRASWVGRGVWPCWARWLGWAWCWACWERWLGWAWCWARWLGWAWCWAWGFAVLGALAGLGVVLGAGFGRAGRASWVGRGVGRGVWPCWARWLGWAWFQSTKVYFGSTKVDFQSTKVYSRSTKIHFQNYIYKYANIF